MRLVPCRGWSQFDGDAPRRLSGSPVFKREFLGAVFAALTSSQGKGFLPRRTLILLDNAHRLDAPSWELLEDLTAKPPARRGRARVVVVLAKRGGAELPAAWERLASFEDRILHLTLQPLDAFASSRLLCAALDVPLHAVTPATVENVRRKCAGLPVLVLALCDDLCGNQVSGAPRDCVCSTAWRLTKVARLVRMASKSEKNAALTGRLQHRRRHREPRAQVGRRAGRRRAARR